MVVDLKRSAALLAALADGRRLAEAAENANLGLNQAAEVLRELAERLNIQAKKIAEAEETAKAVQARDRVDGDPDQLLVAFDGGSRGNPGPSVGGAVALDAHGLVVMERSHYLAEATNNVAEYHGLLAALELAEQLGVKNLRLQSDSELVVRQIRGEYKVKNKALIDLSIEAHRALRRFDSWDIHHVRREHNQPADNYVNEILDQKAPRKKREDR